MGEPTGPNESFPDDIKQTTGSLDANQERGEVQEHSSGLTPEAREQAINDAASSLFSEAYSGEQAVYSDDTKKLTSADWAEARRRASEHMRSVSRADSKWTGE